MTLLALTLTIAAMHPAPPSSLHLVEAQTEVRGVVEVADGPRAWPTGSLVLTIGGFVGAVLFPLTGLLLGLVVRALPGAILFFAGAISGGLHLLMGIAGVIWGASSSGVGRGPLTPERASWAPREERGALVTLATF